MNRKTVVVFSNDDILGHALFRPRSYVALNFCLLCDITDARGIVRSAVAAIHSSCEVGGRVALFVFVAFVLSKELL